MDQLSFLSESSTTSSLLFSELQAPFSLLSSESDLMSMSRTADTSLTSQKLNSISQIQPRFDSSILAQQGINAQKKLRGTRKDDTLIGSNQADILKGLSGNDTLLGKGKRDRLVGGGGDDRLEAGNGDDVLKGGNGRDVLWGEAGDDFLDGGKGKDFYTTGSGKDIVRLKSGNGGDGLETIDILKDFEDGQDKLQLKKIAFRDLNIIQGTGKRAKDTIIRHSQTGEYLLVLQGVTWSDLTIDDFITDRKVEPTSIDPADALTSFSIFNTNFSAVDTSDEDAVASQGGAAIAIGSQRIYTGYRQVSQVNQDPILISFDSENLQNNWVRTDVEGSNSDSRGYGLYSSGKDLYAVFSVDGTQGEPEDDFRRGSSDAVTPWLQSYGKGGGAKVAVIARFNPKNGTLLDAAYISAVLKDGKSNTLRIDNVRMNEAGNLLVETAARFYPRNVDGTPMTKTGKTPAPFDYTVELTPDLKEVISTNAIGVR